MEMKVDHVVFSSSGGAGTAAARIVNAQKLANIDAELICTTNGQIGSAGARSPSLLSSAATDHLLIRKRNASSILSVLRSSFSANLEIRTKSLLHLHWIPGSISLTELGAGIAPRSSLVVTLHDMWPFSGGCHFSDGCEGYRNGCSECPMVRRPFRKLISRNFEAKRTIYSRLEKLVIISPGQEMLEAASQGSIFPVGTEFVHLPNPLMIANDRSNNNESRSRSKGTFTIAVMANDLREPRKNVKRAVVAFERLRRKYSGLKSLEMVMIGRNAPVPSGDSHVKNLGFYSKPEELAQHLSDVDLLWSFSSGEVFPNAVVELAARGTPSVLSKIPGHAFAARAGFAVLFESDHEAVEVTAQLISDVQKMSQLKKLAKEYSESLSPIAIGVRYREIYGNLFREGSS